MSTLPVGSLPSGTHPSSATRAVVSTRDGQSCWLCHRGPPELLTVAHQIASVNSAQFGLYRQSNIIPTHIVSPTHPENLILLCGLCHSAFDHTPPYWIMLPTAPTIQRLIDNEHQDYSTRLRAAKMGLTQPRSLPMIDCSAVRYQIYILNKAFAESEPVSTLSTSRQWLGHPVVAIIKACGGVVLPSQRVTVQSLSGEDIHIGVPDLVRTKLVRLINLWDRPDPVIRSMALGPVGPSVGPVGNSRVGGSGGAGSSSAGGGRKRKTGGSGQNVLPTDRRLRPRIAVPEPQDTQQKVKNWLATIPENQAGETSLK